MSVPELRFKNESGRDFPNWETKKIGDFVLSHKGGSPLKPADFVKSEMFEVIPKKAISSGGYLKLDEAEPTYCSEVFFEANQRSVVDKTYLITTLRDLVPSGPSIGYIVKYINNKKYILAQGVYGIQIDENLIDDFLIQYSNTDKYRELMQTMMVGSTQVHIRNTDFFNTPFSVPNLKEQTKIANFLTTVDEKISHLTQKHYLLTQYKKGVMQQIFSQELRFKDDDGRDFPEWEDVTLKDIASRVKEKNKENNKNVLTISAQQGLINQEEYFSKSVAAKDLTNYYLIHTGDFAYNKSYSNGYPMGAIKCLNRYEKGVVSTLYICFKFHEGYVNSFFEHYFETGLHNKEIKKVAQEGARNHGLLNIGLDDFFGILLNIPSIAEQTKIANFLTAIDDKITATQTQLKAAKQYKQGLLQQMFV